jgi:hypothetical protein
MQKQPTLFDSKGNVITSQTLRNNNPSKKAFGLYGNIYSYPNYGKYRPRFYTLGDTSQGLDTLSRELLVRWSREIFAQLPFVQSAVAILSNFAVGDAYLPIYTGKNKEWWKHAQEWLVGTWYPRCSTRGGHYDFQTLLQLESQLIDVDGDYLVLYGSENGFPKIQIIQNNRIRSNTNDNFEVKDGPYAGTILSDGVYYTPSGKPVAYHIQNASNLVNSMVNITNDLIVSTRNSQLVLDPKYIDKVRGVPAIGSAILQALSIQELDGYLMEKIKIESTIALVEQTPSGEAPLELQNTLEALNQQGTEYGSFNPSPNTHAVDIVQGSQIRYIHAEGGDIKTLGSNSPANETQDYIARLETQVLSTIGIPHQLVYSTEKVGGRITSGIGEMLRAKAMDNGEIPRNDDEIMTNIVAFTHPIEFSLDRKYDNQITTDNYQNGISTLNDTTTRLYNRTAEETLNVQATEQITFFKKVKEVSEATGIDVNTVIQNWRNQSKPATPATEQQSTDIENE